MTTQKICYQDWQSSVDRTKNTHILFKGELKVICCFDQKQSPLSPFSLSQTSLISILSLRPPYLFSLKPPSSFSAKSKTKSASLLLVQYTSHQCFSLTKQKRSHYLYQNQTHKNMAYKFVLSLQPINLSFLYYLSDHRFSSLRYISTHSPTTAYRRHCRLRKVQICLFHL